MLHETETIKHTELWWWSQEQQHCTDGDFRSFRKLYSIQQNYSKNKVDRQVILAYYLDIPKTGTSEVKMLSSQQLR